MKNRTNGRISAVQEQFLRRSSSPPQPEVMDPYWSAAAAVDDDVDYDYVYDKENWKIRISRLINELIIRDRYSV